MGRFLSERRGLRSVRFGAQPGGRGFLTKEVCHIRLRVKLRRDRRGAEMQRFFCDRINRMGQDEEKIGDGDVLSIDYPP